jgi:single-strand DNA-binding protein
VSNSAVVLVGNVVREPKKTQSQNGNAVCRFDIAVNRPSREVEVPPSFYNVTCFSELAQNVYETVHQGTRVIVSGNIEVKDVNKEDGGKVRFVNVLADAIGVELRFNLADVKQGIQRAEPGNERDEEPW